MNNVESEQLSGVKIAGFKSIKECDLNLNKINVLIGSNGSGKSNFISAFTLLHEIFLLNLQLFVGQNGVNSLFFNGGKFTEEIELHFAFDENFYGCVLSSTDDNKMIFKKEYYNSNLDNRHSAASLIGHYESKLWAKIGNDIPFLESLSWRVYHFHDTSRSSRVKQEHNISNNKFLSFDAGNLAAFLFRLKNFFPKSYARIIETIRLIAPYFGDFELTPNEGNPELIVLRWRQRGCEDIFNASQLSDGTLRFICLATLFFQPEELQPPTIIIDEPELGLHPYAITIFAEMVKASEKQTIISTQSAELLNQFCAEDIVVVERKNDASEFKRLDKEELEGWIDEYTLGELWNKNILGGRE